IFTTSSDCTSGAQSPVTQNVGNNGPTFGVNSGQSVRLQASATGTNNQNQTVNFGYWSGPASFQFNPATPVTICVAGFVNGQQVFNPNYNGLTKLAFTTVPISINVNACSAPLTVQTQNASGTGTNPLANLTVGLSSTSGGGQFFAPADTTCSTPIGSVTIATNGNTASFRYRDSDGGTPTIAASGQLTTITAATQTETIVATVPTTLAMNSVSPNSVAFGSTGPVTFSATLTRNDTSAGIVGAMVSFTVDGVTVGSATTGAGGVATFSTYDPSALSVAAHN